METLIENNEKTKFCKHCGSKIASDAVICINCGRQVEEIKSNQPNIVINNENSNNNVNTATATVNSNVGMIGNTKNKTTAIILCLLGLIGFAGFHKFYEGKILMGIIYFLTCGFFLIGTIVDLICLLGKPKQYYV